jgi:thiamine kinase-like enzyme
VILYPHAPGVPLSHQLNRSPRWLALQLRIIGRALVTLHNGPESLQAGLKENSFANEAKVVRRACEHIQILLPETYDKILSILEKLQDGYMSLPQEKPTFTHSDFKADHLLSTPQGLTLIDLDTCTLTDPALDIGKFLADLEWWFTRKGISGIESAQAQLLTGYVGDQTGDRTIADRLKRARLFHVLILVKIVARRVPIYKKEWGSVTAQLIERAEQVLQKP